MFGGLVSNAKFRCLGMSWGCCDNGLKERQRRQLRRGERENFDFLFGYLDFYQKQWAGCEIF